MKCTSGRAYPSDEGLLNYKQTKKADNLNKYLIKYNRGLHMADAL